MKKLTFVAAMLLGALTVNAGAYKHSVGLTVGSQYGFEYKTFVGEHFVVAADLGVQLGQTKGSSRVDFTDSDFSSVTNDGLNVVYWSFQGAANFAYQGTIKDFSAGTLDWFAGGGLSMGLLQEVSWKNGSPSVHDIWKTMKDGRKAWKDLSSEEKDYNPSPYNFKLGFNAYAGVEFALKSVPLVFGMDFRPGYGVAVQSYKNGIDYEGEMIDKGNVIQSISFFDWALNASVRYYF